MNRPNPRNRNRVFARQKGFALVLVLLIVGVALSSALFSYITPFAQTIDRDKVTAAALAQARDALIGRAVSDDKRPGSLPCPDFDDGTINPLNVANDGVSDLLFGNHCPSYIGRLPWRTLGLPDLRDGSGERLWYALSTTLRDDDSAQPINSDTPGLLTVVGTSPATNVVAIVFAPGPILDTQTRDVANENNLANYLEGENANGDNVYATGIASNSFNDRVLFITAQQLMPTVEMRVARELKSLLASYRANSICGCYPWADSFSAADGISDVGVNRGRPPLTAQPENWSPPVPPPLPGSIPVLPAWFGANNWHKVLYYSVARVNTDGGGVSCTTCVDSTLSVDGAAGVSALLFTPGTPIGAIVRPSNILTDYLENAQNNDGADDLYVTPNASALDRDRLTTF